jgi:hypothetical protein
VTCDFDNAPAKEYQAGIRLQAEQEALCLNNRAIANTSAQKLRRPRMQVKFQVFKSYTQSWDDLCAEAAEFATRQGRDRLINLSVSEDDNQGVIVVWYWE